MISTGGGSSSSSGGSTTVFPTRFLDQAGKYFGAAPEYDPDFKGFKDFDAVERNTYAPVAAKLKDAYNDAVGRQNEEASAAGLLNSPAKNIAGGARDNLDKSYLSSIQEAARSAASGRYNLEQAEAARETGFNQDVANKLLQSFFQKIGFAVDAGRRSQQSGSSSNFSFGFLTGR